MNIENFKAGIFSNQFGYPSFVPEFINLEWNLTDPELLTILEECNFRLGELNGLSMVMPDSATFYKMYFAKEGTQSSRIEGTQTEMDETMQNEEQIGPEKLDDWREVQNYIEAMNYSVQRMEELPLSNRLFREAHQLLMQGVRGENKTPGEFRKSQNWIGGVNLKEARFVPPHPTLVPDLMSDLEKFLNNEEIHVPHLIRIALAHYQFEAIHPFLDGNGRIGRLMIILYLVNRKMLHKPVLYLSDYIEKNRMQYYDLLAAVSQGKGIVPWLRFMLRGISETAKSAGNTFIKIFAMRKRLEQETLMSLGKRIPNAQKLLLVLFEYPVITVQEVMQKMSVTKQTAHNLVEDFTRLGILKEKTGYKRNRVFVFEEYMGFFR